MDIYSLQKDVQPFRSPQNQNQYQKHDFTGSSGIFSIQQQQSLILESQRLIAYQREIKNFKTRIQVQKQKQLQSGFPSSQKQQMEIYLKQLELQKEKQKLKKFKRFLKQQKKYRKYLSSQKLQGIENSTLIQRRVTMALSLSTNISNSEKMDKQQEINDKIQQNKGNWNELVKLLVTPKNQQNKIFKYQSCLSSKFSASNINSDDQFELKKTVSCHIQNNNDQVRNQNQNFTNSMGFLEKRQNFQQLCKISPKDCESDQFFDQLEYGEKSVDMDKNDDKQINNIEFSLFEHNKMVNEFNEKAEFTFNNFNFCNNDTKNNFNNYDFDQTSSLDDSLDSLLSVPSEDEGNSSLYPVKFATEKQIPQKNKEYQNQISDSILVEKNFCQSTKLVEKKNKIKITDFKNFNKFQ